MSYSDNSNVYPFPFHRPSVTIMILNDIPFEICKETGIAYVSIVEVR